MKIIGIPVFVLSLSRMRILITAGIHKKISPANFTEVVDLSESQSEMTKLMGSYELMDSPITIIVDAEGNVWHKLEGPHSSDEIEKFLKGMNIDQQEETG